MSSICHHLRRLVLCISLILPLGASTTIFASDQESLDPSFVVEAPKEQLKAPVLIQKDSQQVVVRTLGADTFHAILLNDGRTQADVIHSSGDNGYLSIDVKDFHGEIRVVSSKQGYKDSDPSYVYVGKEEPEAGRRLRREATIENAISRLYTSQEDIDLAKYVEGLEGDEAELALLQAISDIDYRVQDIQEGHQKIVNYKEELIEKPARHTSALVKTDSQQKASGILPLTGEYKYDLLLFGALAVAGFGSFFICRLQ